VSVVDKSWKKDLRLLEKLIYAFEGPEARADRRVGPRSLSGDRGQLQSAKVYKAKAVESLQDSQQPKLYNEGNARENSAG
jgi:hypothetical protein